jgi:hypothetical protein
MSLADAQAIRDAVLELFEQKRPTTLEELRQEALAIYQRERRPVSMNDVRPLFEQKGQGLNPSVLGAVFRPPHWQLVGMTNANTKRSHARRIGLYVPAGAPTTPDQGSLL